LFGIAEEATTYCTFSGTLGQSLSDASEVSVVVAVATIARREQGRKTGISSKLAFLLLFLLFSQSPPPQPVTLRYFVDVDVVDVVVVVDRSDKQPKGDLRTTSGERREGSFGQAILSGLPPQKRKRTLTEAVWLQRWLLSQKGFLLMRP